MPRRMSCSLTTDAVRQRVKTVTRRASNTWTALAAGDILVLVEKAMGMPKGSTQVVLATVEITDVSLVPIGEIDADDVRREGFTDMTPDEFVTFWCESHGMPDDRHTRRWHTVRRIEWRYLDA